MATLLDRYSNIATLYDVNGRRTNAAEANSDYFENRSPLSRNAYGGEAGYQYRRQEEAFGRALRQLRRAARRGDTRAALQEIAVRGQAMGQGFTPGGIRDREAFNAEREAWQNQTAQDAADARLFGSLARRRAAEEIAYDPNADPAVAGEPMMTEEGGVLRSDPDYQFGRRFGTSYDPPGPTTVNPASNPGPGYGNPIGRRGAAGLSFQKPGFMPVSDDPEGTPGSPRRLFRRPRYF